MPQGKGVSQKPPRDAGHGTSRHTYFRRLISGGSVLGCNLTVQDVFLL